MKKYELKEEKKEFLGRTLYRIRALQDIELCGGTVIRAGELGGWIEKEDNLSQEGSAWVSGEAEVSGEARVFGEACISGEARVSGKARVSRITHVMTFGPAGSRDDVTTFYRNKLDGISVSCGCFCGSIDDFLAAVEKTHGDNKKKAPDVGAPEAAEQSA